MPKLDFSPEEIRGYFRDNVKHHFYDKTVEKADEMRVHSDGVFPEKLITERRPNEPEVVQTYRKNIFIAKTKPIFGKIVSSLSKIRRSADWMVKYGKEKQYNLIRPEESLEEYCEKKFPFFESVTNWIFSVFLKKYLEDPNAVVFVFPQQVNIDPTDYYTPYPVVFDSKHVIDFRIDDYAVLENPLGSTYYTGRPRKAEKGLSYYIVTTERIRRYDQVDSKGTIDLVLDYNHGLNELPVWRIGAIVVEADGNNYLHESRISGIIPELNEAIREYSDLQASKVLHIYPEKWQYTQNECNLCKGTSLRANPRWYHGCNESVHPARIACDNPLCHNGYIAAGPYSTIMVRPQSIIEGNTNNIPTPPAGYVEKDVEIVRIQDEGVAAHIYQALASINFHFLDQTPLNQSGTAKEVDKDELNNTVHSIAEDVVRNMDLVYYFTSLYRYSYLYSREDIIEFMIPDINVPEKFDLLSSSHLIEELTAGKTNGMNPIIRNAMEVEYASKKFNTTPEIRDTLQLVFRLDPLANVSEDEKMSRLSNKGILLETYIISSNIHEFVQMAIDEDAGFTLKSLKEQKEKMKQYAKELMDAQKEDSTKLKMNNADTGLNPDGSPVLDPEKTEVPEEEVVEV